uniref:Retrotransposon Copia-like N-terminal domain-containing protein n=1 Tax=Nymphaea colorata TaxID=210225 RepID=A0A5K1EKE7_9MAGN
MCLVFFIQFSDFLDNPVKRYGIYKCHRFLKARYINGKIKAPATNDPNYDEWESQNDMVMAWLLNSTEPSIANLFTYQDTAHGIWEALKELYSEQNNLAQVYHIQCEIANLTLHDQDVQRYTGRLGSLYDEFLQDLKKIKSSRSSLD